MILNKKNGFRWICADQLFRHTILVSVCTFGIILPLICTGMRYSVYSMWQINKTREESRLININKIRLAENRQFLSDYNRTSQWLNNSKILKLQQFDIGITIITVSRRREQKQHYETDYLTQVVGRFLHILNSSAATKRYGLFICNVDSNPDRHKEIKSLPIAIPKFELYSKITKPPSDVFEKEKKDYVFCLNETLKLNPLYVLLVEDDAYPHRQLIPVLEHVIRKHLDKRHATSESHLRYRNVAYVKFYHPGRLLGYVSLEVERIPELIGVSLVFGTMLFLFYMHFIVEWKQKKVKIVWLTCTLFCCLVGLSVGRQNLLELRRLSAHLYEVTPAPSCCTPAILYTRNGGRLIVNHLDKMRCKSSFAKDTALDEIRKREKLVALMVQPNVFEHIGMYSAVRNNLVDPFVV